MGEKITRKSIIDAMLQVSFLRSCGEASLSDIALILDVKKPSLYNYFPSRSGIVEAVLEECRSFYEKITFVPSNVDEIVQKYPVATVFKGIVSHYAKVHEKTRSLWIFTFVESMKYFSPEAMKVIEFRKNKIIRETEMVFSAFSKNGLGLDERRIRMLARIFCCMTEDFLEERLHAWKKAIDEFEDLEKALSMDYDDFMKDGDKSGRVNAFVDDFVAACGL